MKKLLTSVILISTALNVYADKNIDQNTKKDFYYKLKTGSFSAKPATLGGKPLDFFRTSLGNVAPFFGIGIGYYVKETVRVDLTLDHITNVSLNTKINDSKVNYKAVFNNIMVNTYLKMFEVKNTNLFFGLGVGFTHINERASVKDKITNEKSSYSASKKRSLSYMLAINADIPVTDTINCELTYSWKEFGKSAAMNGKNGEKLGVNPYKGHSFGVAVRFDL